MSKFSAIALEGYNTAQVEFIESVEHDYEADEFPGLVADYSEELDALEVWNTTSGMVVENRRARMHNTMSAAAHAIVIAYNDKGLEAAEQVAKSARVAFEFAGAGEFGEQYYQIGA